MSQKTDVNYIYQLAKKLIDETNTMTLATANQNISWAAPVYFSAKGENFYFFSNPKSRHILEAFSSAQAASAIYEESSHWQNLKGIQMSGRIKSISNGMETANAMRAYIKKFPTVKSFFPDISNITLEKLISRFSVRLYSFVPETMYYMDNSIEFGFREEIQINTIA